MYHRPFFPDEIFGWTFFGVLAALTVVAAVIDLRKMVVPKWLTIPTLVLGLVFNTARGAFLGYEEMRVWALTPDGPFLGALDGFLFALVGFLCGFAMFFVMWVLGLCGGGDVKLFAAIGAWVGAYYSLWVLAGSMLVLIVLAMSRALGTFFTQGYKAAKKAYSAKAGKKTAAGMVPRRRLMTYSLPLAIATAAVVLWFFRVDLKLAHPSPTGQPIQPQQVGQNG